MGLIRLRGLADNKRRTAVWYVRRLVPGRRTGAGAPEPEAGAAPASRAHVRRAGLPRGALAFDARDYNPIRWRRGAGIEVAALGPREWLPPGVDADRVVPARRVLRLRRMHHLEDVSAFHAGVIARARTLIRLAAAGAVVHLADRDERLRALLGGELYRLMTADVAGLDAGARELLGIAMRRTALRDHANPAPPPPPGDRGGAGELSYGAGASDAPARPLVSILLATRRPALLPQALAAVARQTYPRLELVLALHGGSATGLERRLADCPHPVRVVRAPADAPLGVVLNAATAASSGTLLTKMDDDDLYGGDHVWDLVLAHEYSQASLVGKGMEFVYLATSDRTLRLDSGHGEDYRTWPLAGGALLVSRRALDRVGGWRPAPAGVDAMLVHDVVDARGGVYRTHGAGFMLVRHGPDHTWDVSDRHFLARAGSSLPGWRPEVAGLSGPDLRRPAIG